MQMRTFICWLLSKLREPAALGFFGAICLMMGWDKVDGESMMSILKIALPIDIILSVWAAVFTYKNFDEVFSRSSRWRNSNVEKFDVRLKYSILVLFESFFAFPLILGVVGLIVFFVIAFMWPTGKN